MASVGLDDDNTMILYDWITGIPLLQTSTDKRRVLAVTFLSPTAAMPYDIVVTAGDKHMKFWWAQGQNVKSQRGLWGKQKKEILSCVASGSPGIMHYCIIFSPFFTP